MRWASVLGAALASTDARRSGSWLASCRAARWLWSVPGGWVNDGTAIVLYRLALDATVGEYPHLGERDHRTAALLGMSQHRCRVPVLRATVVQVRLAAHRL
jgi:hypothetical protein